MKISIRRGIFETNSSSVHAITVTKNKVKDVYTGYSIEFATDEFGWEHRTYYDFTDKARYLWTAIVNNFCKYLTEEKESIGYDGQPYHKSYCVFDKTNPEYLKIKEAIKTALIHVGFEDDGWSIRFEEDFKTTEWGSLETGYIDHTPGIDFINALVFNEDRLIRFLFSHDSKIVTWNDNEWEVSPRIMKKLENKYNALKNEDGTLSDELYEQYWKEREWAHFGGEPKDVEWSYLKGN